MRWLAVLPAVIAAAVAFRADAAAPRIAFAASSYGKVVLLSARGDAVRSFGTGESPAVSADGRRIAFVRDGTRPPHAWQEDSPAWSPDGRLIAFGSTRPGAFNSELYVVRPDGGGLRRLTFTPGADDELGDDSMPAWRPDGSGLVFVSNRDRNLELYALDLATRRTTRLTDTPQDETLPRLSVDGRYAFVVPLPDAGSRISRANASLRGRTVLQAGTAVDWFPN